jgi:hypothetical protein
VSVARIERAWASTAAEWSQVVGVTAATGAAATGVTPTSATPVASAAEPASKEKRMVRRRRETDTTKLLDSEGGTYQM